MTGLAVDDATPIGLSDADPLCLAGIITPGARLPALAGNRILYRSGAPIAVLSAKQVEFLTDPGDDAWDLRNRLLRREAPPRLKSYLG